MRLRANANVLIVLLVLTALVSGCAATTPQPKPPSPSAPPGAPAPSQTTTKPGQETAGATWIAEGAYEKATFSDAIDTACSDFDARYTASQFNTHSCGGHNPNGYGLYSGATFHLAGAKWTEEMSYRLLLEAGYSKLGEYGLDTTGNRTSTNSTFAVTSKIDLKAVDLNVGVEIPIVKHVKVVPMLKVMHWYADESSDDKLLSGSTQLAGGHHTNSTSGTDLGWAIRGLFSPNSRCAFFVDFGKITLNKAVSPSTVAEWPEDLKAKIFTTGLQVRLK
jgi:hypothetical protein